MFSLVMTVVMGLAAPAEAERAVVPDDVRLAAVRGNLTQIVDRAEATQQQLAAGPLAGPAWSHDL